MEIDPGELEREARAVARQLRAPTFIACLLSVAAVGAALVVHSVVGAGVGALAVGYVALTCRLSDPEPVVTGIAVSRTDQPALWDEIDGVASLIGVAPPDEVVIGADVFAQLVHSTSRLGRKVRSRRLVFGLPVMALLTLDELRAVLISLLARDVESTIPRGPLLARSAAAAEAALAADQGGIGGSLRRRHLRTVHRQCAPFREAQTLIGDSRAADVVGRTQLDGALRRAHVGHSAYERFAHDYLMELVSVGVRPANLYEGLRHFGSDPVRDSWFEELHVGSTSASMRWNAGEPTIAVRLLRNSATHGDEKVPDRRGASALLAGREPLERALTELLMAELVPGVKLRQVLWEEADVALATLNRSRAGRLGLAAAALEPAAPRSGGLAHVIRLAVTSQREGLASMLAPELADIDDDDRPAVVGDLLATYLRASLGSALSEHARCSWVLSWSGAAVLRAPDGTPVDIDEWVSGIVSQQVSPRVVTDWLVAVGVPLEAVAGF